MVDQEESGIFFFSSRRRHTRYWRDWSSDVCSSDLKMSDEDLLDLEEHACPGAGACGGQYTANTMAMILEFLGLSPMGSAGPPALDGRKDEVCARAGKLVMELLERGLTPERILTREAFDNGIAAGAATGGSTNLVLHLLAIAREVGVPLGIDDFNPVSSRTPIIADLKPGGRYTAVDVDRAGGSRLLGKRLLDAGLIDGTQLTTTGRTIAEDRKSTRLNSSHANISYAVFCLKKKKNNT